MMMGLSYSDFQDGFIRKSMQIFLPFLMQTYVLAQLTDSSIQDNQVDPALFAFGKTLSLMEGTWLWGFDPVFWGVPDSIAI